MRLIARLAVLGVLAVGVAGCEDTYGAYDRYGYGPDHYRDRSGYDYRYDRDSDTSGRPDWDRNGARVYCRDDNDRYYPCDVR